ncbi:MAG TPA: response regulator [Candidatus Dorea gallistercoris]|uniref:Stage 0 sporulation protein A homolog n=1 Tax=Candidatus Dorea gallistercoris TaxID=2838542 RepID=A0A9D1RA65_9FIRM|nr:response regulator [Candidatus Dorea gallistercoris]
MKYLKIYSREQSLPNTLLIIDDDAVNRMILKEIFQDAYTIIEAENGREGLEMILERKNQICAVLLDVIMPVMDGMELLKELNRQKLTDTIPVFLISAEVNEHVVLEGYELGVMDVIEKPVLPHVVRRRVDSVVELFLSRRSMRNLLEYQQMELVDKEAEIVRLNMGMIEALATAIEFRSGESGEHVHRIRDITKYLLLYTSLGDGISPEAVELIGMGAVMHDVGKIAISDTILNKPGKLTPEEYEIMKTHTIQGAKILEKIPQMKNHGAFTYAHDIARHHHERWDGSGYPDGLKGDEITIWSQIVSLADVYDALVSKRVYKEAYGFEEAVRMIQDGQCGVFNPEVLDRFMEAEYEIRCLYQ